MAQLNDLIVNGYTRFLNSAYGNLNGSATSALCAANAATAVKAADSDKLGGTAAANFALKTGAYTATTQLSAYSAVVAGSAPVGSHTISSHSDSANFFSGNSAKSACSATSAKNAGTATKASDADKLGGVLPAGYSLSGHNHAYKLSGNGTAVNVSAGVNFKPSGSNIQFFVSGNDIYISGKDTTGTDTKVTQSLTGANSAFRILLKKTANNTDETSNVVYDGDFTYNPSSNLLSVVSASATNVRGVTVSATNVTAATTVRGTNISGTNISGASKTATIDNLITSASRAIPTVNNKTITITTGASPSTSQTFTLNQSTDKTISFGTMAFKASGDYSTTGHNHYLSALNGTATYFSGTTAAPSALSALTAKYALTVPQSAVTGHIAVGTGLKKSGNVISVNTNSTILNSADYNWGVGDSNTVDGNASFVAGLSNTASGGAVISLGSNNYASGGATIALGHLNSAFGQWSFAIGVGNKSVDNNTFSNSICIGYANEVIGEVGPNIAMGLQNKVYSSGSTFGNLSIGTQTSALQTTNSFVGGINSIVETYSGTDTSTTNIGTESDIRPTFAFGYNVSAKGGATVFGFKNFGLGENSGHLGKAYTSFTAAGSGVAGIIDTNLTAGLKWYEKSPSGGEGGPFIVGSYNVGYHPGTFVAGISSYGMSPASFVACKGNVSFGYAQTVIGKYNKPEDSLFTIGAGINDNTRKNVFSVWSDSHSAKFFIGRGTDGANSSYWATDYPEFYVGNTLKLYGTLSANGSLLAHGNISAGAGNIYGSNIYTTGTLTSNYFVTTNGVAANNFTATNIITSSISSVLTSTNTAPLILSYTAVNADAGMSANCAGISASYNNPGGSWEGNASWYNIITNVKWITNNTTGNSANSAVITEKVDVTTNTTAGNVYLTMNKGDGHLIQNSNFTINITGGTLYASKINGNLTAGSANSALTSKSALSAGSASTGRSVYWSKADDNTDEDRVIALTYAGHRSIATAGNTWHDPVCYDKDFTYNSKTNILKSQSLTITTPLIGPQNCGNYWTSPNDFTFTGDYLKCEVNHVWLTPTGSQTATKSATFNITAFASPSGAGQVDEYSAPVKTIHYINEAAFGNPTVNKNAGKAIILTGIPTGTSAFIQGFTNNHDSRFNASGVTNSTNNYVKVVLGASATFARTITAAYTMNTIMDIYYSSAAKRLFIQCYG